MTVTFGPALTAVDTDLYRVSCDDGQTIGEFTGYALAYSEAQAHALVCPIDLCQQYGADVDRMFADDEPVPVNVSNRNAADLLAALGYPLDLAVTPSPLGGATADLTGSDEARAFLDRVALALGVAAPADAGLPEIAYRLGEPEREGATVYDMGRAPGYLAEKLRTLRALAEACARAGVEVTWA